MSVFDGALAAGSVARFNMIIPNDCENGHDRCGTHNAVHQFDDFVAREVPKIEASPAFGADGLIVVVWDEGSDADPLHVGGALLGPQVKPSTLPGFDASTAVWRQPSTGFARPRHLARTPPARLHLDLAPGMPRSRRRSMFLAMPSLPSPARGCRLRAARLRFPASVTRSWSSGRTRAMSRSRLRTLRSSPGRSKLRARGSRTRIRSSSRARWASTSPWSPGSTPRARPTATCRTTAISAARTSSPSSR